MLKRKTIFLSIAFSVSALLIMIGAYVTTFYVFYYDTLQKNAFYGPYYVEKGNYRTCSVITEFLYDERDVWPFRREQFSTLFHPLIWREMKNRRQTREENGKPFDISRTRERCIARGLDAGIFDGDIVISYHRRGPILIKIDYFGAQIIADFANVP